MLLVNFLNSSVSSVVMKAVEVCGSVMQSGFLCMDKENKERTKLQLEFVKKLDIHKMLTNVSHNFV
jgi:hypothetical protein